MSRYDKATFLFAALLSLPALAKHDLEKHDLANKVLSPKEACSFATGKLIFFASWCASCVAHLSHSNPSQDLYINVFDDPSAGEAGLRHILKERFRSDRLIFDKHDLWSKHFAVRSLPASIGCAHGNTKTLSYGEKTK